MSAWGGRWGNRWGSRWGALANIQPVQSEQIPGRMRFAKKRHRNPGIDPEQARHEQTKAIHEIVREATLTPEQRAERQLKLSSPAKQKAIERVEAVIAPLPVNYYALELLLLGSRF